MLYGSIRNRMRLIYLDIRDGRLGIAQEDLERLQTKLGPQQFLTQALLDVVQTSRGHLSLDRRQVRDRLRGIPRGNYPEQTKVKV